MTISYLSIICCLLLMAIPGYLLARFDLPLLQRSLLPVARMVVQMGVVAIVTWLLWHLDKPWVSLLWLVAMALVAAWLLVKRARLQQLILLLPVWAGIATGVTVAGGMVLMALRGVHPLSARWMIPVGAVLMAHVLTTNLRGVSTYFETLRTDALSYYTRLGNGASRLAALTPYVRQALRSMMAPALASLTTMGLFGLPMLLSGLLMGGMEPLQAVALFMILVVASITASSLALVLTLWVADRRVFNKRGELKNVFMS